MRLSWNTRLNRQINPSKHRPSKFTIKIKVKIKENTNSWLIFSDRSGHEDIGLRKQIVRLQQEVKRERRDKERLNKIVLKLQALKDNVSKWMTPGMLHRAVTGKKTCFRDEDIAAAIPLRNAGPRAYRLLRKRGCPLPSVSTLQRWAAKVVVKPGIIKQIIPVIKRSVETSRDRLCVLSFDEIKVREEVEYIRVNDTVVLNKRYTQVVMVRGLTKNWKQAIYYGFDDKMTVTTLMDVINELEKNELLVVAVVSDLGPTNRACWNELKVNHQNPQFKTDTDRDVFVFSDTPHLLKCIRNHFVDSGFVNNGVFYNAAPVVELLVRDSKSDLRICPRITVEKVMVTKASRQKVKPAARLFSHSVSKALLEHGGDKGKPTAWLFKLVNDWFDVFNSNLIRDGHRERKHAFGLQMEVQMSIIKEMTTFFESARVVGHAKLQPFQHGILLNNKALPRLLESLKKYDVNFLLTRRLNQDELESFFGVIRFKGGLHDHPSTKEFTYRLRNCILGN